MKLKKIAALILAAVICVSALAVSVSADDEKGITLNKSSITMVLGGTYTLKPTLKGLKKSIIQWSSSDKSVATVAKGGVVTAKKAGTAKITVKVKDTDYKAVCTVKVRLPKSTKELVRGMGAGWSLYNSLDVTGADWISDIKDYETAWGKPAITKEQIKAIKNAGFNTLRIPVCWKEHMDSDGKISTEWLDRVQEVVDYAYDRNMYVILDAKDGWISVKNEKSTRKQYAEMWRQIAERFKEYNQRLIFEGLSETLYCIDESESGAFPISGRKSLNNLYADFVKTVRSAGGYNEKRFLIVTPSDSYAALEIPDDERILVGVANLAPYQLSDGNSAGKKFDKTAKQDIINSFDDIKKNFIDKGYNVVVTQWGIADKSNTSERIKAAEYYIEIANKNNIPCIWAEWIDELFNRETLQWDSPKLTKAITDAA